MGGLWRSLEQAGPSEFYLWGRAVTALFGTATVFLVFRIGMRWGARHALLAAGLMAVLPSHVRESHYVLTDVPMTFFTSLTFLLTLRAPRAQHDGRLRLGQERRRDWPPRRNTTGSSSFCCRSSPLR